MGIVPSLTVTVTAAQLGVRTTYVAKGFVDSDRVPVKCCL